MLIVSALYDAFRTFKPVAYAFMGIRAGVPALIVKAALSMAKACRRDAFALILMAASFVAVALFGLNSLTVILAAALIGLGSALIARFRGKGGAK